MGGERGDLGGLIISIRFWGTYTIITTGSPKNSTLHVMITALILGRQLRASCGCRWICCSTADLHALGNEDGGAGPKI